MKSTMAGKIEITYFDLRGRAEVCVQAAFLIGTCLSFSELADADL